jgi:hypothetical protein
MLTYNPATLKLVEDKLVRGEVPDDFPIGYLNLLTSIAHLRMRDRLMRDLVPAFPSHYSAFLKAHKSLGGVPTHNYSYDMPFNFYIAVNDTYVPALHGPFAVNIIVPKSRQCTWNDLGENSVFFMNGVVGRDEPVPWVPCYQDTRER